jgi:hypothetical protein
MLEDINTNKTRMTRVQFLYASGMNENPEIEDIE